MNQKLGDTVTLDRQTVVKILDIIYTCSCQLSVLPIDRKKRTVEELGKISDMLWDAHNILKEEINCGSDFS